MAEKREIFAGIDAGGTTFKCGLADCDGRLLAQHRVPTKNPQETLQACADFFTDQARAQNGALRSLGIASFGPIDVDPLSADYGTLLNTPKPGWRGTNLKAAFEARMDVPVSIDTDVNGALLAEMESGAGIGCRSAAYVTVGTGIGAGIFANGNLIGKPAHPEFGHIRVARHPSDDFTGACSFHGDCLEGMASAKAFSARYGDPETLPADHPGWQILAFYLAQACWSLSLSFRPERILLGGGIMLAPHLINSVRHAYLKLSGGYLGDTYEQVEALIARPSHGDDAGLLGGLYLARQITAQ